MRIISYQNLMQLPPVLSYKRNPLIRKNEINLNSWQNELIATVGGQLSSQAFREKVMQLSQQEAGGPAAVGLKPETTIFDHLYQLVAREYPNLAETRRAAVAEQYLQAAYLLPYQTRTTEEVSARVCNQLLLALTFALNQKVMFLPDVFAEATFSEKTLLQRAIRNLRLLQKKNQTIFIQTQLPEDALYLADRVVVLEPSAAGTIGEVIPIFFPEPRNRRILSQLPAYKVLRKRLHYLLTDAFAQEDLLTLSTSPSLS
jgi:ABC-type nitrate/sulfonate/bicarbonate transport system ATPase subunit